MTHHPIRAGAACVAIAFCSGALAADHIVDIAWSSDGRFAHQADIKVGKFVEVCGSLSAGQRVRWRFTSAAPVDFNIHHHVGKDTVFSAKQAQVVNGQDTLHVTGAQDHCWMWTNRGTAPVHLAVDLAR